MFILVALVASFCGILQQLTRIFLGARKRDHTRHVRQTEGVPAMALLLGGLLLFSVWLPASLQEVMT